MAAASLLSPWEYRVVNDVVFVAIETVAVGVMQVILRSTSHIFAHLTAIHSSTVTKYHQVIFFYGEKRTLWLNDVVIIITC